ncbi:MAG TPA: CoA-binding protein [Bacteroidetes bacterium]|nr:CoA-binding protein [Bacteroidota bacterium]
MEYDLQDLAFILQTVKTIAVVGLSPKPERDSHKVAAYLMGKGYRIIPVNPGHPEILGQKSYPSLFEIPERVDLVDVFRRSEFVRPIIEAAIQLQIPYVWLQEGIRDDEGARLAKEHGITVVQDLCAMKIHALLEQKGLLAD